MVVVLSSTFKKAYTKLDKKIKDAFTVRLKLFIVDEFNPRLNNHGLKGNYHGVRSISITGNFRAHYVIIDSNVRQFVEIGTHSQLYKK